MATTVNILPSQFAQIDSNVQQIGKSVRSGLRYHKTFLSNNDNGQWQLVNLGLLDIFLRNYFGYYKNTHLKDILKAWNQYRLQDNPFPNITKRLTDLWSKTYPKKNYPPYAYFMGNSKLHEAQLIAIGLLHTDPSNAFMTGKILSKYANSDDLILVEGIDADVSLDSTKVPMTALLNPSSTVQGWEPVGYTEIQNKIFAPALALDSVFRRGVAQIIDFFKNLKLDVSSKFIDKAILNFIETIKKIEDRENSSSSNFVEELQALYKNFLNSSQDPEDCARFLKAFRIISNRCQQLLEKKKYTSLWSPEASQFFQESWPIREASLCNEIEYNLSLGKRIFICAGSARFFPNKGKSESQVVNLLKNYKYTIGLANTAENDSYYSFHGLLKKSPVLDQVNF